MSTGRSRMLSAGVAALAVAALAGCGSDSGSGSGLSLDRVRELAEKAKGGATACPVDYDVRKAAKAAGLAGRVGPVQGKEAAQGEVPDADEPKDTLGTFEGALVACAYKLNDENLRVYTVAAGRGSAPRILMPVLQAADGVSMDQLVAFDKKAADAKAGSALRTPHGHAAVVRLPENGGDVALAVTIGEGSDGGSALTAEQVGRIAEGLAAQVD